MKKIFFYSIAGLVILGCNQESKKDDSSSKKNDEAKALYEKNLATLQASINAFESENIDGWAANIADTAKWYSPAYGDTVTTKQHWKDVLAVYMADWDSLKLVNPNFLPGIDSSTHEFDGSVRYYGAWNAVHKSGVHTSVSFYGTYDFNKDNKVISGNEFFDVGGLMNAIKGK